MAALHEDRRAGPGGEPLALVQRRGPVHGGGFSEQDREFGEVGRDQVRERQQRMQRRLIRLLQQPVAAGRHHHGIQDHDAGAGLLQPAADRVNDGRVPQHPDFDGVDGDVLAEGFQLGGQEGRRRDVDGADAAGVLGGQGGDGRHAVAAVCGDALEVGLDPRAAGGVGAGDGQHPRDPGRRQGRDRRKKR